MSDREPLIEVGLLIVDRVDDEAVAGVLKARSATLDRLRRLLPTFTWRMPVVQRAVITQTDRVDPTALLDEGIHERNARHWDFAIVLTHTDLLSYYRPYALAAPSRAVSVAVLSTARLAGPLVDQEGAATDDDEIVARRVAALSIHLLGDLNGLSHCPHAEHFTFGLRLPEDLDRMRSLCDERRELLEEELGDVADLRLEEEPGADRAGTLAFYARAIRINLDDITSAVRRARPWEFPLRLGRVTAAALSALLILLLTAEVWELGSRQPPLTILALSATALLAATAFALERHRLLLVRGRSEMTEQLVTTNTATTLVVLLGMAAIYVVVWVAAATASILLFDDEMVRSWTGTEMHASRMSFAGFVASVGLLIGGLGSTFEGHYFRHVVFVDEET